MRFFSRSLLYDLVEKPSSVFFLLLIHRCVERNVECIFRERKKGKKRGVRDVEGDVDMIVMKASRPVSYEWEDRFTVQICSDFVCKSFMEGIVSFENCMYAM